MPGWNILTTGIRTEVDVVLARQRARQIAELLGLDAVGQTRLATAVSEIARNAFRYARGGRVEFSVDPVRPPVLLVRVSDQGPGMAGVDALPGDPHGVGTGRSAGIGIARRLTDRFEVHSSPEGGTTVLLGVTLHAMREGIARAELARIAEELARRPPESLLEELHQQNQELAGVLEGLRRRQQEMEQLNQELEETNRGVLALYSQVAQELEDTNRGVLALYAELDDRAEQLRHASRVQRQFFSYISHEFRTPLHSTIALSNLLLGDGYPPVPEQHRAPVRLIRRSATELMEMVGDLLDLARIDAGRLEVHSETFPVAELFSALRGMFRPLTPEGRVTLVVEDVDALPSMHTDPRKLAQILRNLVANALKFTERGEVRVAAAVVGEGGEVVEFRVTDTGVGVPEAERERIFDDFVQADNPFQRAAPGSGIGLPLSRRLAELLGGRISLRSEPGSGSTFTVRVPLRYRPTV